MNTQPYFLYVEDDEDDIVLLKDMLEFPTPPQILFRLKMDLKRFNFYRALKKTIHFPALY
jgi:hypothetical protein